MAELRVYSSLTQSRPWIRGLSRELPMEGRLPSPSASILYLPVASASLWQEESCRSALGLRCVSLERGRLTSRWPEVVT